MMIVDERYDRLKRRISPHAWERIKAKAQWEGCTLSAVVCDWPTILPKRIQPLARSCFVSTRREWLLARRVELLKLLRYINRELAKESR